MPRALPKDGRLLRFVPARLKTAEMCLLALENTPQALEFIPDAFKTQDMCMNAVSRSGKILRYVPDGLKTFEMCSTAVQRNGSALQFVPDEYKTEDMCNNAIHDNIEMFDYTPCKFKTMNLCIKTMVVIHFLHFEDRVKLFAWMMDRIPKEVGALNVCIEYAKLLMHKNYNEACGVFIKYIQDKFKTKAFCMAAVKTSGLNLAYVPEWHKTAEMCLEGVRGGAGLDACLKIGVHFSCGRRRSAWRPERIRSRCFALSPTI